MQMVYESENSVIYFSECSLTDLLFFFEKEKVKSRYIFREMDFRSKIKIVNNYKVLRMEKPKICCHLKKNFVKSIYSMIY